MTVYSGLVDPLSSTFIFVIINTIILFVVLRKVLFKPVREFMQERSKGIEDSIKEAEMLNKEALQLKEEYAVKLKEIQEEGREIIKTARGKADEQAKEILNDAYDKTSKMIKHAEEEIARENAKAMNEMKDEIASIAIMTAEKILQEKIDQKENQKIVEKFLKEIGEVQWQS